MTHLARPAVVRFCCFSKDGDKQGSRRPNVIGKDALWPVVTSNILTSILTARPHRPNIHFGILMNGLLSHPPNNRRWSLIATRAIRPTKCRQLIQSPNPKRR
jgi:hypothetical protein